MPKKSLILAGTLIFLSSAAAGYAQTVTLAPLAVNFPAQLVGTTSGASTVTLTNTSKTVALTIASIATSGDFVEANTCVSPIAPLGTCTLSLKFSPNTTGTLNGAVTITDNAATSPQVVSLIGTATGPVAFTPATLTFPSTAIGATSSALTITVTNKQATGLTVSGAKVSGDYAISSNSCSGSIASGGTCTLKVTFTPTVAGTVSGVLTFSDNAADSPEIVGLSGKATGTVANPASFSPASLTFTGQQTGTVSSGKIITLTNKGATSLTISAVNASGDYIQTNTCAGHSIAANGTCTITVKFAPSATGTIKGAITVSDAAATSPQVVALTGTGAGALSFSPGVLAFGIQELGVAGASQSATLTNHSSSAVSLSNIAISGRYSQTNTCSASLAAKASCTFTVSVAPAAAGTLDGAVTVTDAGSNSPQILSLTTTGKNPPRFAYVANSTGLLAYTVNPVTSQLRAIASLALPADGNINLHPNNKFLYLPVGTGNGSAINGYTINAATGSLAPLAGSPFTTVSGSAYLLFTTDGKFAFSGGAFGGAKQVESFSVNTTTGALTSLGTQPSGNACSTALTPSNNFFYQTDDSATGTIYGYSVNTTTGALTPLVGSPFSGHANNCGAFIHPSGKFFFTVNASIASAGSTVSVYAINATTGALTEIPGSPFAGGGLNYDDWIISDPTGRFLYIAVGPGVNSGQAGVLLAYSVNLTTGALTPVPRSPYGVGHFTGALTMDPTGKFLYVGDLSGSGPTTLVFSINTSTGALTQIGTQGIQGDADYDLSFVTGTAPVAYTPSFAYVTNHTSKSISEFTINDTTGALTAVAGSPLADSNGPQVVAATTNGKFVYTGNSNGSISEYKVNATTGALTKMAGSPLKGLGDPVALVVDPTSSFLLVVDQTTGTLSSYTISSTGALTFLSSNTTLASPVAVALDPTGVRALVTGGNALEYYPISLGGVIGSKQDYNAGARAVSLSIDPTSQYLFQTNTDGNLLAVYTLLVSGVKSGALYYNTGNVPSAVLAEPSGRFVYVANNTDGNISAFSLANPTGVLTPISGPFNTGSGPAFLAASNNGKYLYAVNKGSGTVSIFTINSDGTLTAAGSATTAAGPSSIVTLGTYK